MIKHVLSEEERTAIEKNGYTLQNKDNMLIIRNYANQVVLEITYVDEDEVLIGTSENFYWGKKINTIVSAYGEALYVYYTSNKGEEEIIVGN